MTHSVKNIFSKIAKHFKSEKPVSGHEATSVEVLSEAKKLLGDNDIVFSFNGWDMNVRRFNQLYSHLNETGKAHRTSKTILPFYDLPIVISSDNDDLGTGIEIKTIDDIKVVWFVRRDDESERNLSYIAMKKSDVEKFKDLYNKEAERIKQTSLPDNGIYVIEEQRSLFGTSYIYNPAKLQQNPVVCESTEKIIGDIRFFFDHLDLFSRFGQKPSRKILMAGEPGTGKTSICYKISETFKNEALVVFVKNRDSLLHHAKSAALDNRRTIIVCEDADLVIDAHMLNFLDGIERDNIENGLAIIFTSNHPERMEKRITKRPGRIDKIYKVGNLTRKQDILEVFNIYFGEYFDAEAIVGEEENIYNIFKGCTGAQIKELSNNYIQYVVSNNIETVLIKDLITVKKELFDAYDIVDTANQESIDNYRLEKYLDSDCSDEPCYDE